MRGETQDQYIFLELINLYLVKQLYLSVIYMAKQSTHLQCTVFSMLIGLNNHSLILEHFYHPERNPVHICGVCPLFQLSAQ